MKRTRPEGATLDESDSREDDKNRSDYGGYKVIFIPFKDGRPAGLPMHILTDLLKKDGSGIAHGRPVGVAIGNKRRSMMRDDTASGRWR